MANPLLPPMPSGREELRREKRKSVIVKQADLYSGNVEYNLQKAQNFSNYGQASTTIDNLPEPLNTREAMTSIGTQLQDQSVAKDDAWWKKALGMLDNPVVGAVGTALSYMDVPMELGIEVIEGVIPGKWAGEGTAPREDWAAWKALFGEDQGSMGERFGKAAAAFEQRPFWMQMGMIGLQIAATGGAGLAARGILAGAKGASVASRISAAGIRAGGYVVDPAELAFRAVGKGVKGGSKALSMSIRSISDYGIDAKVQRAGLQQQPLYDSNGNIILPKMPDNLKRAAENPGYYVVKKTDPNTGAVTEELVRFDDVQAGDSAFSYNSDNMANPRFGNAFLRIAGDEVEKVNELPNAYRSIISNPDTPWGARAEISPILRRGNEFRRLFGDLWKKGNDSNNLYDRALYYKELAQVQLQLSMASRPGVIENLTTRQLKEFIDTELLTVAEGAKGVQKGDRTGLLKALDNGESWIAVNKYMTALDELGIDMGMGEAIFGLRFDGNTVKKMAVTAKNETNTISILRKYLGQNYELTPNAANIRNQRASEMWLEGFTFDDIQGQLGHGGESPRLVYTYIQDIDNFIGNDTRQLQSKALERLRATGKISMAFDHQVREAIGNERLLLDDTLKEARKNKNWGQRKSKYAGQAEETKTVLEVGGAYLRSDELLEFMNPAQVTKYEQILADTTLDLTAQKTMLEHIRLEALSELAYEMRLGYTDITRKMDGITGGGSISQKGKLERAGYKVTKKNGRLMISSVAKDAAGREKFAKISALDTMLGRYEGDKWITDDAAWDNWANGLVSEYNKLQGFLDEYASITSLDGVRTQYKKDWSITDLLAEYIDTKAIGNYNSWMTLSDEVKDVFGAWENDILRMRMIGSGRSALSNVSDNGSFFKNRNKYRKSLNAVYNDLDPKFAVEGGAKAFGKLDNSIPEELASKVRRVHQWTQQEGVAESFKAFHVNEGISKANLLIKLRQMAKNNGDLFGTNFNSTFQEIPKGKKQPVRSLAGEEYLEEIANILTNNNLLQNFKKGNNSKILDFEEYTHGAAELRPDLFGTEEMLKAVTGDGLFHGISPKQLASSRKSIEMVVEDMGGWDWARQWNEYNSGPIKHFMDIARPLFAVFAGGQGQMARGITKPISAAGHLYRTHERDAIQLARTVKELSNKVLGVKTDVASDELRRIGIKEGNQWFDELVLKPRDQIEAFEARLEVREAYKRTGQKGTKEVLPTWRKIIGVTRNAPPGTKFAAGKMADPENMLRQVDVVLERIPPQYWDNYFELSDDQRNGLLWIKSLQSEIDKTATARGVDIVGTIEDKGGEYLTNYLPRLYRNAKNRVKLGQRKSPIKLLNNYNTHFQKRTNPDILDNLAIDANLVNMEDALSRSVLEPLDQRLGMYYEVMSKEGTNVEARKVLQEMSKEGAGFKNEFSYQLNQLDNLERIFNDRVGGIVVGDGERLTKLSKSRQALNGDGSNKIDNPLYEHSWLAEGIETVTRARSDGDAIRKSIQDRRMVLKGEWDDLGMGTEVQANMWLDDTFRRMTKRDQLAVRQYLQATPPTLLKPVQRVAELVEGMNQMVRTLKSGFDLGTPMIHGYNSLVKLPWFINGKLSDDGRKAWGIATNNMRKAFMNTEYLDEYMIQNHHLREQASPWIMLGEAEPLQSLQSDYGPMKILRENAAKFLDPVPGLNKFKAAERFEKSFVMFTDSLRMELWKSLEPSVTRTLSQTADAAGKMIDPTDMSSAAVRKAYSELGAVINKMTGVFDQDLANMTPLQRLLESSLVFFAPMYRRATYGIIADLARGGIRRREAIRQLSGVVAAGAGIAFLLEATGNNDRAFAMDEDGNPDLTYRFGKVMYGGYMTGIGTAWNTAFRLLSDITMEAQDNDNPIDEGWFQSPYLDILGRKGRSQFAPSMGMITDLVKGRSYNGDPLRDDGDPLWGETIKHIGKQALPFWLDISAEGGSGMLPAMGSEFIGLSSYRVSEFDKMATAREYAVQNWDRPEIQEWRNSQLSKGGSVNWVALPARLKQLIQDEDPTTRTALQSYEEVFGPVARNESGLFRKYREKRSEHDLRLVQTLAEASADFERGDINGKEFGAIKAKAYYAKRTFNEALLAEGSEYNSLVDWFSTLRKSKSDEDMAFQGDILYDMWMTDVVHHPDNLDPETGEYSWDVVNRHKADFIKEHKVTAKDLKYIEDRRQYWIRQLPLVLEYETAMKDLSPYFNIHDTIWKPGTKMNAIATKFFSRPPEVRNRLKEQYSIYKKIDSARSTAREKLRQRRPDIDWILVRWYGNKPRHRRNEYQRRELEKQLETKRTAEAMGGWEYSSPKFSDFSVSPSGRVNTGI